ncbi:MAG: mxaJ protein [Acidobacteriota bacterium]|nr:mxaJ protein [Acidobacteriota bacterium]
MSSASEEQIAMRSGGQAILPVRSRDDRSHGCSSPPARRTNITLRESRTGRIACPPPSLAILTLLLLFALPTSAAPAPLRVCSDPNNLPFSNQQEQGFENRIAQLVARDLGTKVEYFWWAQRRGFVRNTLTANKCDVILGVPSSFELALTTRPYYRSTYVFVTRKDRKLDVRSFDDPRLKKLKIGVQMIGDDYASSPPAHALANRGIVRNVAGYSVYGDYTKESPPKRIVEAVAAGEVDVSAVWGPTAGYFIRKSRVPLVARAVSPEIDLPFLPFVFDISMAVRRGDTALRDKLEAILDRRADEIDAILREYGVPRVDL